MKEKISKHTIFNPNSLLAETRIFMLVSRNYFSDFWNLQHDTNFIIIFISFVIYKSPVLSQMITM